MIPAATGAVLLPFGLPPLPVEYFITYSNAIGLVRNVQKHGGDRADLPVHYALKFGWREMVENVAEAFETLSNEERIGCPIITNDYSKAGAVNYYRGDYGLPDAISGHNSYRFWTPEDKQVKEAVTIGITEDFPRRYFRDVELFRIHSHPYAAKFETGRKIIICRNPAASWSEIRRQLEWY